MAIMNAEELNRFPRKALDELHELAEEGMDQALARKGWTATWEIERER